MRPPSVISTVIVGFLRAADSRGDEHGPKINGGMEFSLKPSGPDGVSID